MMNTFHKLAIDVGALLKIGQIADVATIKHLKGLAETALTGPVIDLPTFPRYRIVGSVRLPMDMGDFADVCGVFGKAFPGAVMSPTQKEGWGYFAVANEGGAAGTGGDETIGGAKPRDFFSTAPTPAAAGAAPAVSAGKPALEDGQPCHHAGCLSHVTHPCEGCGRINGRKATGKPASDGRKADLESSVKTAENAIRDGQRWRDLWGRLQASERLRPRGQSVDDWIHNRWKRANGRVAAGMQLLDAAREALATEFPPTEEPPATDGFPPDGTVLRYRRGGGLFFVKNAAEDLTADWRDHFEFATIGDQALAILDRLVRAKNAKDAHGDCDLYRDLKAGQWEAARALTGHYATGGMIPATPPTGADPAADVSLKERARVALNSTFVAGHAAKPIQDYITHLEKELAMSRLGARFAVRTVGPNSTTCDPTSNLRKDELSAALLKVTGPGKPNVQLDVTETDEKAEGHYQHTMSDGTKRKCSHGPLPCPKCGTPCPMPDHTGMTCLKCEIYFDSGLPENEAEALASTDPVHVDWIDRIRAVGWLPRAERNAPGIPTDRQCAGWDGDPVATLTPDGWRQTGDETTAPPAEQPTAVPPPPPKKKRKPRTPKTPPPPAP